MEESLLVTMHLKINAIEATLLESSLAVPYQLHLKAQDEEAVAKAQAALDKHTGERQ